MKSQDGGVGSIPPTDPRSKAPGPLFAIYKFLASLKLAVVMLLALAAILGTATFYESIYDTKTAQHLVYTSPWFALFLAVLFINVFCATSIRYPWKKHQTGFVITHLGILILLIGSMITMLWGVDGQMAVAEGSTGDRIVLDQPVLLFGRDQAALTEIPAEFRWSRPREDRPYRYPLSDGITAVVDGYYHHSVAEPLYVASPKGEPAVKLEFTSSRFGTLDNWLTPSMGKATFGPASARLQAVDEVPSGEQKDLDKLGFLQLLVKDEPFLLPVQSLLDKPRKLDDTPYTVRVVRYLGTAVVVDNKLVDQGGSEAKNPCVEVAVKNAKGHEERYYLFANLPQLNTRFVTAPEPFPIRGLYELPEKHDEHDGHGHAPGEVQAKHHMDLFLTPDGKLHYRFENGKEGVFEPGEPVSPGWMDIQLTAREILPSAKREVLYREFTMPKGEKDKDGPPPAIRVRLEGSQQTAPFWVQYGDLVPAQDAAGKPFYFGYAYRTVPSGVTLELVDFEVGYDPGTKTAATYKSQVKVDGAVHTIQMNEPLHKNDFTFFQSSFQEQPGGPAISVFSVAYDPGIVPKYLGSILLVAGIFTMFYLKPHMTGKKKPATKETT